MSNPVLTREFDKAEHPSIITEQGDRMTIGGVVRSTGWYFLLLLGGAVFGWINASAISRILLPAILVLVGVVIATAMRPHWVKVTGPIYALAEGALVGAISRIYSEFYDGIVTQAVLATLAVFVVMLLLYSARVIRVTDRLRSTVVSATGGILLFYLVSIGLSFFNVDIPLVWDGGPLSILISLVIVGVAAFNLMLDFDMIEKGIEGGAPGWMNQFAAFGLLVTIVWLYLELLRLLSYLASDD